MNLDLNILFLSELFYPHYGGAEYATYLWAKLLSDAGINVVVVSNRHPQESTISRDGRLIIQRLRLFSPEESPKYSVLKRVDVLLSGFMNRLMKWADVVYFPRFWYSAVLLAKAHGKPVIIHAHDYLPVCPLATTYNQSKTVVCKQQSVVCSPSCIYAFEKSRKRNMKETLMSMLLNSTVGRQFSKLAKLGDAIICVSNVQRNMMLDREPSLQDRTHVVHNPFPEYTDLKPEGFDFGYFGGSDYLKGFDVLCRASFHNRSKLGKKTVIQATKLLNVSDRVARSLSDWGFVTHGKLGKDEYARMYKQIRTVIVPSVWNEPWPYVVVEALAQRRLLIASRIGGIPEQVEGCKGAFLCEPGDSEELADTIEMVANLSRQDVESLGSQNRETFLKRFDNESSIRKFINICEHLT